ncbi:MAG: hypothetical protein U5L10_05455 [Candidatus Moranbacteria bacterium]|nr:hypothetical protein [Candidatus Moranbacteria bacterium]
MKNDKQKKLLFTAIYLNTVNRPPTTFELWRFLVDITGEKTGCSFDEVLKAVEELAEKGKIKNVKGFWVFPGREKKAEDRIAMHKRSVEKLKRAGKWIKWFYVLPYFRGVVYTGALAFCNCRRDSDWDILAVMKKDRIWIGRFFLTGFLMMLGKKRSEKAVKNKFCLNHFLTENNLVFSDMNEYSAMGISSMGPLAGKKYFDRMQQLNFTWMRFYAPNFSKDAIGNGCFVRESKALKKAGRLLEDILEFLKLGDYLNKKMKEIMIGKIEKNPKTYWKNAFIAYNDGELAFWPKPKRIEILNKIRGSFEET